MLQQNKFKDLQPYSMYKRGNNFFLKEITKNAYDFNLKNVQELQKLKDILKQLAETKAKESDNNKKIVIDKEIMTILQYYKLVHQISDSLVKQLSKIGLGHSFYDVKTIQKYQEEIISHIPKFFEEYNDVTEFTESNWSSWKLMLIDKYLKANGFKNLQQNKTDLQKKNEKLAEKPYTIANSSEKFRELYNSLAEESYKMPEDVIEELNEIFKTPTFLSPTLSEFFYTVFFDSFSEPDLSLGEDEEPPFSFRIPLSSIFDFSFNNKKYKVEFNKSYTNFTNFIDKTLDTQIQDYKEHNNIEFDSFTPYFNDGKKRKIKKH
jgi:hypothetical protein